MEFGKSGFHPEISTLISEYRLEYFKSTFNDAGFNPGIWFAVENSGREFSGILYCGFQHVDFFFIGNEFVDVIDYGCFYTH